MNFCTHCGHALATNAASCDACGTIVRVAAAGDRARACATCTNALHPGWRHCAECGAPTGDGESPRSERTSIAARAGAFALSQGSLDPPRREPAQPQPEPFAKNLHR